MKNLLTALKSEYFQIQSIIVFIDNLGKLNFITTLIKQV